MNNAFTPPAYPRPSMIRQSGHQSALKIVFAIFALMIAAVLGLVVLVLIGSETGPLELIIGMICAMLPVPIYIMVLLWIDRYESEPLWMLATSFLWGALVAVFVALILNTISGTIVAVATHSVQIGENFGAIISAPIVEESAKAFILLVLFLWKNEFDGIIDGIVYAGMVGLGFAMTENILYYGRSIQHGIDLDLCRQMGLNAQTCSLTLTIIVRGMLAPFSHPLFTSMTGIGLGWSRQSNNGFIKVFMPGLGLMVAILLHATWNAIATYGGDLGFFAGYFLIMGPAFIVTLMVIYFSLKREGRIVREFLQTDCQSGFFDPIEYERLCTVRGRMGMSWNAMRARGFAGWRARMRCNQIASELAFHRSRVARGFVRDAQSAQVRESDYLHTLRELRQKLNPAERPPR
jgi:RsiW-degrading membrane proteinase PrsW (M82 family)